MAYSPKLNTSISAPNKLEIYWINKPMKPTAMAMRAVFLYPIFTSILQAQIDKIITFYLELQTISKSKVN